MDDDVLTPTEIYAVKYFKRMERMYQKDLERMNREILGDILFARGLDPSTAIEVTDLDKGTYRIKPRPEPKLVRDEVEASPAD